VVSERKNVTPREVACEKGNSRITELNKALGLSTCVQNILITRVLS